MLSFANLKHGYLGCWVGSCPSEPQYDIRLVEGNSSKECMMRVKFRVLRLLGRWGTNTVK